MKNIYLIALLALASGMALPAQTTNAPAAKPVAPRAATRIDSDSVDFDMNARQAIYRGHVRVTDPQMNLTCAILTADLPAQGSSHISRIVADTNVVVDATDEKGQKMRATGDRVVYTYEVKDGATNELIMLTGNAQLESAQGWLTGEPIVWNRANNHLSAVNQQMVFRQNFDSLTAKTNAPSIKTNAPSPKTNANLKLPKSSDAAPGVIKNVDQVKNRNF